MKFFLISSNKEYAMEIAKATIESNDEFTLVTSFTTSAVTHEYEEQYDQETISTSFRNNAVLYVTTHENISEGVLYDDFVNSDIVCCTIKEFNMISNKILNEFDIFVIWIDSREYGNIYKDEVCEVDYLEERLQSMNYEYLLDPKIYDVVDLILENKSNNY